MKLHLTFLILLINFSVLFAQNTSEKITGDTEDEIIEQIDKMSKRFLGDEKETFLDAVYFLEMMYEKEEAYKAYSLFHGYTNEQIKQLKSGVVFKGKTPSEIIRMANKELKKYKSRHLKEVHKEIGDTKSEIKKNREEKKYYVENYQKNVEHVLDSTQVDVVSIRENYATNYHLECHIQVNKEQLLNYNISSVMYRLRLFNENKVAIWTQYIPIENYTNDKWQNGGCYLINHNPENLKEGTITLEEYSMPRGMTYAFDIIKVSFSDNKSFQIDFDDRDKIMNENLKNLYRQLKFEMQ